PNSCAVPAATCSWAFITSESGNVCDTITLIFFWSTANTLSWTWYLLSQHLEVEGWLHEELDRVLDSRLPAVADLKSLSYTESAIAEALRLYPLQWMMTRRVLNDYQVGNYVAPTGSLVVVSPYVMHRDARYFGEPRRFQPQRWTAEFKAQLPSMPTFHSEVARAGGLAKASPGWNWSLSSLLSHNSGNSGCGMVIV